MILDSHTVWSFQLVCHLTTTLNIGLCNSCVSGQVLTWRTDVAGHARQMHSSKSWTANITRAAISNVSYSSKLSHAMRKQYAAGSNNADLWSL